MINPISTISFYVIQFIFTGYGFKIIIIIAKLFLSTFFYNIGEWL